MRLISPTAAARAALCAALVAVAACDNSTEPSTPSQITVASGAAIPGRVGDTATVIVTVLASNSKPLSGQAVTFAVTGGGGAVNPASATTDANGQASTRWAFGTTIGAQTITATSGGITQTITATATAGLPRSLTVTAGASQTVTINGTVATPPAVTVRDAGGNPVPGAQVTFQSSPSGTVTPQVILTDASGVARLTSWQVGPQAGTYTLTATVLAQGVTGNPATITATAAAGAPATIAPTSGANVSATAGSLLTGSLTPSVVVRDAGGNPVSGVQVTFSVLSGGGTLTGATQTTNAQGVATVGGFTLGRTAGANVLQATAAGAGTTTLAITGTAGPAAATTLSAGGDQAVRAGQTLPTAPSVRVVDQYGNPVSGAAVTFAVGSGGGSITGATQTTNAQGIATVGTFTLGATPGPNTLIARVAGASDLTINATGLAGAPTAVTVVSGDAQSVVVFKTAANPFVVKVVDAEGFAVQGATVSFALANAAGGALSPVAAQTDASGLARATFTANGFVGLNTVTATVGSLPAVQFTINTTQNIAATISAVGPTTFSGTAGTAVGAPAVLVRDAAGTPVPNIVVFFQAYGVEPFGTVQNREATTDMNGVATAGQWTLSTTPGENVLAASVSAANVPNNPIYFRANGVEIPLGSTLTLVAGTTPTEAPAGSTVSVAVQAKTAGGAPLANVSVAFQVTTGGGTIGGEATFSTVTDASGIARVPAWVLGSGSGTINTLVAVLVNGGGATKVIQVTNQ